MKIVAFNGSHRAEKGNTHLMVEALLAGARRAGAESEHHHLAKLEIRPCLACKACWMVHPGRCAIRDDVPGLLESLVGADVALIATPVYVDNVTGIMKLFMDRLMPLGRVRWEKDESGECRHVMGPQKIPDFVLVSNCGFPETTHFQVIQLLLRRMTRNLHNKEAGEVLRGGGGLLTNHPPALKPLVEAYFRDLERAGEELASTGGLSPATEARLARPLAPLGDHVQAYIDAVNRLADEVEAKVKAREGAGGMAGSR